jgi:hypothetical protein
VGTEKRWQKWLGVSPPHITVDFCKVLCNKKRGIFEKVIFEIVRNYRKSIVPQVVLDEGLFQLEECQILPTQKST